MMQESTSPSGRPAQSATDESSASYDPFTDEELSALEELTRFETEHRRILAMQSLFYRRHAARDVG
jgi:hypothetical protein